MDAVGGIELTETGTSSHLLRDLFEYATPAFIASDIPEVPKHWTKLAVTSPPTSQQQQRGHLHRAREDIMHAQAHRPVPTVQRRGLCRRDRRGSPGPVRVRSTDQAQVRVSSLIQVWEGPAAVEDRSWSE